MRAYDFLLFLALLGSISATLDYMYQSDFSDNWFGTSGSPNIDMVAVDINTINNLNDDGEILNAEEHDSIYTTGKALASIVTNTFKMLFRLDDVLDTIFYVPDPNNPDNNLFAPINDVIMVGVYIIVAFGIYQIKTKTSTKFYE